MFSFARYKTKNWTISNYEKVFSGKLKKINNFGTEQISQYSTGTNKPNTF